MGDLISKTAAYDAITTHYHHRTEAQHKMLKECLDGVPSVDAQPVKHGRWEMRWHTIFHRECPCCSECSHFMPMRWFYCPNCGADMRGGQDG